MAQPAASYMMSALGRRLGDEDSLTEVMACVLAGDPTFCHAMLTAVGLNDYRATAVETQVATGQGLCTTDVCLSLETDGRRRAKLWSEHKLDSPFGKGQLDNYEAALTVRRARGERLHLQVILAVPPKPHEREQLDRMEASILMWSDVADIIERVQRARAPDWYDAARRPGASAELRVLTELVVYLEEEVGLVVMGPLDNEKLSALQNVDAARDAADALLKRVAESLNPGGVTDDDVDGESEEAWLGFSAIGWWNELTDGVIYLWVAPVRWFDEDADPVVSFGVAVEVGDAKEKVRDDDQFLQAVERAELRIGTYPETSTLLVGDSVELSSVADRATLSEQAEELARFARDAIQRVARCVPTGLHPRAEPRGQQSLVRPLDPEHL